MPFTGSVGCPGEEGAVERGRVEGSSPGDSSDLVAEQAVLR